MKTLAPGDIIGIIGNGQLGRMTALAAARLGLKTHVFGPEKNSPAEQVADHAIVADYTDHDALIKFADAVDVVTFEFENIPHESVQLLSEHVEVRPNWNCLALSQDRIKEKSFINNCDIETAPFHPVSSIDDLYEGIEKLGTPCLLKTNRLGYDGKGQFLIKDKVHTEEAFASMNGVDCVLEGFVDFEREISVIIGRAPSGEWKAFNPAENVHKNGILDTSTVPANIDSSTSDKAIQIALKLAEEMDIFGLLAVEMFHCTDGKLVVNEVAARPHNSGHWTMDACITDQFEQFVRAVSNMPLGSPTRRSDVIMKNLIGSDVDEWKIFTKQENAKLHLYGKAETRDGRKMGHVNIIK